jgi:hypothetical protein
MSVDSRQARWVVEELLTAYVDCIDNDRLEDWPDFFTESCVYKIIPWENVSQNLAIGWMDCDSHGMLQDRVVAHRTANLYAPHRYRHIVGSVPELRRSGHRGAGELSHRPHGSGYCALRNKRDLQRRRISGPSRCRERQGEVRRKDRRRGYGTGRHAARDPYLREGAGLPMFVSRQC